MTIAFVKPLIDTAHQAKTASFGASSAASTGTWTPDVPGVLVWATQACYIAVVDSATAATTTNSTPVPANTPIAFQIPPSLAGNNWRVSAYGLGTAGVVYAKPINQ